MVLKLVVVFFLVVEHRSYGCTVGCWFMVVEHRFMVVKLVVGFGMWNIVLCF